MFLIDSGLLHNEIIVVKKLLAILSLQRFKRQEWCSRMGHRGASGAHTDEERWSDGRRSHWRLALLQQKQTPSTCAWPSHTKWEGSQIGTSDGSYGEDRKPGKDGV